MCMGHNEAFMWNRTAETMLRDELQRLQVQRLRELVARAALAVPFYARRLGEAHVRAEDIRSLDDLARIPLTTKHDLRENYPFGMVAVPFEQVVRIHASSGTTGKPVVGPYTHSDMTLWAEVMARTLAAGGVTRKDIVHNAYGYGLFTGGLGFSLG